MTTYGPYTPVRSAGNLLFVSGQVGIDPATKIAPVDIEGQTKQVLKNIAAALENTGASIQDVVKTTIFVTNVDDFSKVNSVYELFFDAPRPARSTIEVAGLPKVAGDTKLLVEIEALAYKEVK